MTSLANQTDLLKNLSDLLENSNKYSKKIVKKHGTGTL
jgi:hypothetical protein